MSLHTEPLANVLLAEGRCVSESQVASADESVECARPRQFETAAIRKAKEAAESVTAELWKHHLSRVIRTRSTQASRAAHHISYAASCIARRTTIDAASNAASGGASRIL